MPMGYADRVSQALVHRRKLVRLAVSLFLFGVVSGYGVVWLPLEPLAKLLLPRWIGALLSPGLPVGLGGISPQTAGLPSILRIFGNNLGVASLSFLLGMFFGLPSAWILFENGLLMGSLSALSLRSGQEEIFLSLVLPHGVWELPAMILAGAAGLTLGQSFWRRTPAGRKKAFRAALADAVPLFLTAVPLLLVAAVIEGTITPSILAPSAKLVFAALEILVLLILVVPLPSRTRHSA